MKKIKLKNKLGRPGITYDDVCAAMKHLIKEKKPTTLRNLKIILVHGGSNTISQYRAKYFAEHKNTKRSDEYVNGWRDAMKAMKVFIMDNNK